MKWSECMIDPKFNELPDKPKIGSEDLSETELAEAETPAGTRAPRQGLSVNDTIAADANLSVGGRGVNTSGVNSGAGAGAGSSYVTPGSRGETPAANVRPGPIGSGTTPLSDASPGQTPTRQTSPDEYSSSASSGTGSSNLSHDEIASQAYRCWHERGCPTGSPEEDWHRAEQELRQRRQNPRTSSATA